MPSQKFPRNGSGFNHKSWMEDTMGRNDSGYPFQVRTENGSLFGVNIVYHIPTRTMVCLIGINQGYPIFIWVVVLPLEHKRMV